MADWLRRLWSKRGSNEPTDDTSGQLITGRAAAFEVESRICDALIAAPGTPISAQVLELAGQAARLGARLIAADGGPAACANNALGLALSGERVACFVGGRGLSTVASSVSLAARRLVPMVTYAWLDRHADEAGHADWHRLEGTGALLAMAATPQEACDLAVALRLATESTLCPAVLGIDGRHAHPASPPDWEQVTKALGGSSDEVRSPTPTQVDVFGRDRRRVPAWLDPSHPVGIGQPASPLDAGMIAAGRTALFGGEVDELVRKALSRAREVVGRPVGLVRRHLMDDADFVLVAQGAVVATAEKVAADLRSRFGWRVGVLGITWISPFPASDLAADLGGKRAVFVIERTPPSPGDDPPLVRRVRAVVRGASVPVVSAVSAGAPIEEETLHALCATNIGRLGKKKKGNDHPALDHHVRLDIFGAMSPCELPRRAAMEARVRANHPSLAAHILSVSAGACEAGQEQANANETPGGNIADRKTPALLARIGRSRIAPDSLPRVWGDVLEPREHGPWPTLPDPIVGSGAVPALASALLRKPGEGPVPRIRPDGCTACGRCWTVCPEGAIGAIAIDLCSLLDSASRLSEVSGEAAEAVRRAHHHIANKAAKLMDDELLGPLPRAALQDAWDWAAGKLGISEADLPAHEKAFQKTLDQVERLEPRVTDRLFREIAGDAPATEVLILAVNKEACSGCGVCSAECPEAIIEMREEIPDAPLDGTSWSDWENIDDTSGMTCDRLASDPEIGAMASQLLSRHCSQAMVGNGAFPGSGERLGLRLTTAVAEHHGQMRAGSLERRLGQAHEAIKELLGRRLSAGIVEADASKVAKALSAGAVKDVKALADALDRLGEKSPLDRQLLLELASLTGRLDAQRNAILHGADGLGRSRFALVLGGSSLAERIAPYPEHPFFAPLVVDTSVGGGAMGLGVAEGIASSHIRLMRDLRRAEIEVEAAPDRPGRIEDLSKLSWSELSTEERAGCPPLLFVLDDAYLSEVGAGLIPRLLSTELPVKVVLLDGLQPGRRPDPAFLALAQQRAFVLSSSLGHPDHLARGLEAALTHPGPAFIHIHAPVPQLHGFAQDATLERARAAVASRAHVLMQYDPEANGAFGLRLSLDGNPALDSNSSDLAIIDWAAGESRFGDAGENLPQGTEATYQERWLALRELSGEGGLLAERLEAKIRESLSLELDAKLAAHDGELEEKISEAAAKAAAKAQEHLTQRLLGLAVAGMEKR